MATSMKWATKSEMYSQKPTSWAQQCEEDEEKFQLESGRAGAVRDGVSYATALTWKEPELDSEFIQVDAVPTSRSKSK